MGFSLNVDPRNPGQFLACCGVLELAFRFFEGAEGYFCSTDGAGTEMQFKVDCHSTIQEIVDWLINTSPVAVKELPNGLVVKPLIAPLRFGQENGPSHFVLDAWTRIGIDKRKAAVMSNPPWNLWSGNQTSIQIWTKRLRPALERLRKETFERPDQLLTLTTPLDGRFGFDPGAAWNALDTGFSPNTQKMRVASSPATEMLAAFGLQRFRPVVLDDRKSFLYSTWDYPLAPTVASAVVATEPTSGGSRFRARIIERGQYAAFGYADGFIGATE